nr:putative ribonuclease H-like domain-containing protein [Tanacetum cinerariifolium]
MEAQYGKFLDMIYAVRIIVPLIDNLAGMPNYGKFLKEFISNKHKIKQISAAFISDESSATIQNKVPPKLEDPESFLIPCNFSKTFSCTALADLCASINLMPYSLYAKLALETLKPTEMSVRLADRSFQYPVGIAENMLVECTLPTQGMRSIISTVSTSPEGFLPSILLSVVIIVVVVIVTVIWVVLVVDDISPILKLLFVNIDYSLWKVILNGDSPTPTRIVDGGVQSIAPITAKQRLAKKNDLKTRGTLLMALLDKHQLKLTFTRMPRILWKLLRRGRHQLEIVEKSAIRIYEAKVKGSSTSSQNTQNIAFVSLNNTDSTNEPVNVIPSIFAASSKAIVSNLPNVDSLSDVMIYSFFASQSNSPQLENEDLKQIDADFLEEMDLKWQMAMLTIRARRRGHFSRKCRSPRDNRNKDTPRRNVPVEADEEPTNYALMAYASSCSSSSSGSDNEVAPCFKACSKAYATLQTHYDKFAIDSRKSQFDVLSYKIALESVEARLDVYQQKENVFEKDIKLLKLDFMLRDNALVKLRKKFKKAKKERDDLKLTLEKFQTSSKNLKLHSYELDDSVPISPVNDRYKTCEGYHDVPPPYTRTFMPPKPDLVFNDAPNANEIVPNMVNVESSSNKTSKDLSETLRPDAPIIKDWTSNSEDETEIESVHKQKDPSFAPTSEHVKTPRESVKKVEPNIQAENLKTNNKKPVSTVVPQSIMKSPRPVKHVVNKGNPHQALKDKGVIDIGFSRHMTGNISFLSNFKEFNGGYVAFGRNPKGGKISGKDNECVVLSSDFKLPDENHILLRVPRENNMYNVDLKNAEAVNTSYYVQNRVLVTKPHNKTPYELLLGRSHSIGFMRPFGCPVTILNILDPLRNFNGKADEGFLVGYSVNSKAFRVFNNITRIVQETLHINFLENKPNVTWIRPKWLFDIDTLTQSINYQPVIAGNQPNHNAGIKENLDADPQNTYADVDDAAFDVKENEIQVHVSLSGSDKTKKHDDKAKRADKGKSLVGLPTEVRDLRAKFKEFSSNSTNRVIAASALVTVTGPNSTNSTNNFNTASPSDTAVSPNFRNAKKSSFVDPSKYPDDSDMPELEDIIYLDDEEDVGAEANFSNLETNISVSPILTTRMQKDHHVNQIIDDLNSAPQTRSMERMVKEQVYKMDVKSAFLYGTIEEELYVFQPLGFEDPDYLDKVYKVVKVLYRLHQAPRAWYEILANYLLENRFQKGKIDQTLFIKNQKGDILLVQVYVDDIIFGSTNQELCKVFDKLMKDKFQMSFMGELTFFLGLQVKQKDDVLIEAQQHISNESPLLRVNTPRCDEDCFELMELMVFMASATIKKVKDMVPLRALIDGKKVVVTEDVIRQDLRLDDADGVECLPNEEIFAELARQNFNFSKYIFDSMVRNVDSPSKFLIVGKGFSRVENPLFALMLVQPQDAEEEVEVPTAPTPPSPTTAPSQVPQDHTPTPHATPPASPQQEQPIAKLEQDKHTQALDIIKLKKKGGIEAIDADEDITLLDVETQVDMNAELQGMIDQDVIAATKDVSAVEPTVFDDEEVTMTMAQTLIKMKAKKAKLLDEKYQSLKRKPVFIAQARKNMIIYLKNMAGYKMEHFKGMTYDKVRPIFKREYKKVQTLFKLDKDVEEPTKKRVAEETLLQESFKKLKEVEVLGSDSTQETPTNDPKEMSKEDVQNMLEIVLIIRVGGITKAYQSFKDMLKGFDKQDLVALWRLVKEKFSLAVPNVDKEKALWVDLKRLFEPDADDLLWKLQRYMHYPITWKLHTNCRVHQVSSTTRRYDMFMLTEKDYPLSNRVMTLMISAKLQVEEDSEMAKDLVMKIFMEANKPKSRRVSLDLVFLLRLSVLAMVAACASSATWDKRSLVKSSEELKEVLPDEGSKILHSIKGTLLEEEIFAEFDEFMEMTVDKNSDSEFDTEEPPFKKITINTDYKIKTSLKEPPTNLELKPLPNNLEYVFLEEPSYLPVIISSQLSKEKKNKLVSVLKKHKQAFT